MGAPHRISFDRIADRYDETRSLPASQMEAVLETLIRAFSSYDRVLEVGVGTGRFGVPLQQRGIPLIGVDIAARMIEQGRRKGLQDVLLGDALSLPFADGTFDAALSVHVLHLLPDWQAALAEFGRVTRDSYFTVATNWKEGWLPYRAYWDFLRDAGYKRRRKGVFERELPERLPPREQTDIGTFLEEQGAQDVLQSLENRVYSGQWETPEDLHRRAVEAVRKEFAGQGTMHREKTITLLRWDARDLRSR